ncbi:MAG TPA: non-homologous end-joining DNA ligase [Nitriliruptorales bacterium]
MGKRVSVDVDGQRLSLGNLDKVMYPAVPFTKAEVIDYYTRIAPVLLSHMSGRPLTMIRYPDGVEGNSFFEKRCPSHRPDFVTTITLGREGREKVVDHCDIDSLPALVWVANLAALELHTTLAARPDTFTPTMVVFDLDPGAPAAMAECSRVALLLRDVFDQLGIVGFPKTSGSKGLQVYVPLNVAGVTYEQTRGFALAMGQLLERVHPELVVTNMAKDQRKGRVFVDWSQNHLTKTTVCAYSLRARPRPTVSTPVTWDEVTATAEAGDDDHLVFEATDVLDRVDEHGDLFAETATLEQELPDLGS